MKGTIIIFLPLWRLSRGESDWATMAEPHVDSPREKWEEDEGKKELQMHAGNHSPLAFPSYTRNAVIQRPVEHLLRLWLTLVLGPLPNH